MSDEIKQPEWPFDVDLASIEGIVERWRYLTHAIREMEEERASLDGAIRDALSWHAVAVGTPWARGTLGGHVVVAMSIADAPLIATLS
jgi:hypothetical protein